MSAEKYWLEDSPPVPLLSPWPSIEGDEFYRSFVGTEKGGADFGQGKEWVAWKRQFCTFGLFFVMKKRGGIFWSLGRFWWVLWRCSHCNIPKKIGEKTGETLPDLCDIFLAVGSWRGSNRHCSLEGFNDTPNLVSGLGPKEKTKKIWFWLRKALNTLGHTLFIAFFFWQKCAYTTSIECFPGWGRGGFPAHPCYRRLVFRKLRHYPIDSRLQAVFQAVKGKGWGELVES